MIQWTLFVFRFPYVDLINASVIVTYCTLGKNKFNLYGHVTVPALYTVFDAVVYLEDALWLNSPPQSTYFFCCKFMLNKVGLTL